MKMLSQPLLTEDGYLNQACLNELNSAIINMPKTYERLKDDLEWGQKRITSLSEILGAFAQWAVRLHPYCAPLGLENVLAYLQACLRKEVKWDEHEFAELSLCDVNKLLHDILMDQGLSDFDNWNESRAQSDGQDDCPDITFSSRYGGPDPYHDVIDLDALLHNVCLAMRDERRHSDAFNKKFEEEYGKLEE